MRRILAVLFLLCIVNPCFAGEPVSEYAERESLGGGLHQMTIHSAPIAYRDAGKWQRIDTTWTDSGDATRPHAITKSRLMTTVGEDGMRRIHPTREVSKYVEIGAPYVKPGANWVKVPFSGAQRSANRITWSRDEADLSIVHAGHYLKLDIELKGGYVPPNGQFAFPVGIQGLTRSGSQILDGGTVVMTLRAPVAYDADNLMDIRPIESQFVQFPAGSGNWYILFTLPDLTGMSRPVVDPTMTLQPEEASSTDTYIRASASTSNYDGLGQVRVQANTAARTLIKFSVPTLPKAIKLISREMKLYAFDGNGSNGWTLGVYRLKLAWVENQVTWLKYNSVNTWTSSGGFHVDDCEQTAISTVTSNWTTSGWRTFILPLASADADLGNGYLIKDINEVTDSGYIYFFDSTDSSTPPLRPQLVIQYRLLNPVIHF